MAYFCLSDKGSEVGEWRRYCVVLKLYDVDTTGGDTYMKSLLIDRIYYPYYERIGRTKALVKKPPRRDTVFGLFV